MPIPIRNHSRPVGHCCCIHHNAKRAQLQDTSLSSCPPNLSIVRWFHRSTLFNPAPCKSVVRCKAPALRRIHKNYARPDVRSKPNPCCGFARRQQHQDGHFGPKMGETPRSFSAQPGMSLSGSAQPGMSSTSVGYTSHKVGSNVSLLTSWCPTPACKPANRFSFTA